MTRKEAKTFLLQLNTDKQLNKSEHEALRIAIKVLGQESCSDVISRQAVIDACDQSINLFEAVDRIKELAPVTPQPKTGHWFIDERPESDRETICSNCEQPIFKYHKLDFDYRPKYCPNCGARMIDPQESEDKE
jgi:predicted RNA-binding Zn-ribbon protein involved in translation (DUF1610 family)